MYLIQAIQKIFRDVAVDLRRQSREKNLHQQIIDLLLYKGNFMQLLEGDKDAVNSLYKRSGAICGTPTS